MKTQSTLSIFIIVLLFIGPGLNAQITLAADSTVTQVIMANDINAHNTFTNDIPQQKNFKWTRNIVENTDGWEYGICDNNTCYNNSISTAEILLGPSETSTLDVHLYPNGIFAGSSLVEMTIEHTNDSSQAVIAYYIFNSMTSFTEDQVEKLDLTIYPNPSQGLFTIDTKARTIDYVTVYDLVGNEVGKFGVGENKLVDLRYLKSGTYIFDLYSEQDGLSANRMVSKL